jgi:DNA invertase Pin-like site-specific DNA recombinase
MKILYVRTSTIEQKTDRQRVNEKDYQLVIEDKCSGSTDLFDREGGKRILKLIEKGLLKELHVWEIDRLGRNLLTILKCNTYMSPQVNLKPTRPGISFLTHITNVRFVS